jgi:hypothetical protein
MGTMGGMNFLLNTMHEDKMTPGKPLYYFDYSARAA